MTFSVPDDLHREMRAHKDIKWSEVARAALRREVDRLHYLDDLLAGSRLTEADAGVATRHRRDRPGGVVRAHPIHSAVAYERELPAAHAACKAAHASGDEECVALACATGDATWSLDRDFDRVKGIRRVTAP